MPPALPAPVAALLAAHARWTRSDAPGHPLRHAVREAARLAGEAIGEARGDPAPPDARLLLWASHHLRRHHIAQLDGAPVWLWREALVQNLWTPDDVARDALALHRAGHSGARGWLALTEVAGLDSLARLEEGLAGLDLPWVSRSLIARHLALGDHVHAARLLRLVRWPEDRALAVEAVAPHLAPAALARAVDEAWGYIASERRTAPMYKVQPLGELLALCPDPRRTAQLIERVEALPTGALDACQDHDDLRAVVARALARDGDVERALTWSDRVRDTRETPALVAVAALLPAAARERIGERAIAGLRVQAPESPFFVARHLASVATLSPTLTLAGGSLLDSLAEPAARHLARLRVAVVAPERAAAAVQAFRGERDPAVLASVADEASLFLDALDALRPLDPLAAARAGEALAEALQMAPLTSHTVRLAASVALPAALPDLVATALDRLTAERDQDWLDALAELVPRCPLSPDQQAQIESPILHLAAFCGPSDPHLAWLPPGARREGLAAAIATSRARTRTDLRREASELAASLADAALTDAMRAVAERLLTIGGASSLDAP